MSFSSIITIIIIVLIALIIFKILKSVIKTVVVLITLGLIFILVFGGLVLIDANNFKESIFNEDSNFILVENDTVLSSIHTTWKNFSNFKNSEVTSLDEVDKKNTTFIVKTEALDGEIKINNQTKSWDVLVQEIKSTEDVDVKNSIFSKAFTETASNEGPLFLFKRIKDKTIVVMRESFFVKFIKVIPEFLLKKVAE